MPGLVDIILPSGEHATVPQADLAQAQAAGAHTLSEGEQVQTEIGGLLGQAETAVLGAGRVATFGLSDALVAEGANIVGGESLRKDTLKALTLAKEANPYSHMAGEFAGLMIGGPTDVGSLIEEGVSAKLGEGLAGRVASMGARGAGEGALIEAQNQFSEAYLGDHELNGEKFYTAVGKGALLGGTLGAGLGWASHGLSQVVKGSRGPVSGAVLDEIAGAEGAGRPVADRAAMADALTSDLQRGGMTSEQAAKVTDEIMTMSRAKAEAVSGANKDAGMISGALDEINATAMAKRAGGNAEALEAMQRHYGSMTKQLLDHKAALDVSALKQKSLLDRIFRARETLDRLNFTERPEQFARLMGDEVNYAAARDMTARLGQEAEGVVAFLDSTAADGNNIATKKIGRQLADMRSKLADLPVEGGSATQARDAYMAAYRLKQEVGKHAGFGIEEHLRTPAQREFTALYKKLATGLENTEAFGRAGLANAEWNKAFSDGFRRAKDFEQRFAVRIDEAAGVPVPEASSEKIRDGLLKKMGNAVEREQPLKSTDEFVNWFKQRADVIERHAEILPSDAAKIADGRAALKEFESSLTQTTKEAEVIARVERMQLEEQGKGIGGLIGLGADIVTRPMTTIERLAALRNTTRKVEEAIDGGLKRFFGGKSGTEVIDDVAQKVRAPKEVAKDIAEVKTLAANPSALEARATELVGDMRNIAPKTAEAAKNAFKRAIYFLANEAPQASVSMALIAAHKPDVRYSPQAIRDWETKQRAALDPKTVVSDMQHGKLNREAIRTIEFVSPKLYAEIQSSAQDYLADLASKGLLDNMPRQQQAVLASLLKVPADGTWRPDFIAWMQAAKAMPAPQPAPAPVAQPAMVSKRAIKLNTGVWETESYAIEKR